VSLTNSLRKFGFAELVSVGPSKEPDKKPVEEKQQDKEPDDKQEGSQQEITCVFLQTSCDPWNSHTYYCSDENPNACSIS
jgi:hypothetical protein